MIILEIDGKDVECDIIGVFSVEDKEYIGVMPVDDEAERELLIFAYTETDEYTEVSDIEDDKEYDLAYDTLTRLLENSEIEEDEEDLL
jgi:hypothetical protein